MLAVEETTTTDEPEQPSAIKEAVEAVRQAAAGQQVLVIRISMGRGLSISKVELARALHAAFPKASVEITEEAGSHGSLVVKDIEVK
jgi:hypothetical protein